MYPLHLLYGYYYPRQVRLALERKKRMEEEGKKDIELSNKLKSEPTTSNPMNPPSK